MPEYGKKDGTSVIIVTLMVLISGILRFIQESKSNKAAEKLGEMVETTINVSRSGKGKNRNSNKRSSSWRYY